MNTCWLEHVPTSKNFPYKYVSKFKAESSNTNLLVKDCSSVVGGDIASESRVGDISSACASENSASVLRGGVSIKGIVSNDSLGSTAVYSRPLSTCDTNPAPSASKTKCLTILGHTVCRLTPRWSRQGEYKNYFTPLGPGSGSGDYQKCGELQNSC